MNKEAVNPMDHENAEAICAKIQQDADAEVRQLLERARTQSQSILDEARGASEAGKAAALHALDKEIEKVRDRILSTLNLEKKRLILDGKQAFVENVLAEVKRAAVKFRADNAYPGFLMQAVVEGVRVLEVSNVAVYYAAADEHIFSEGFVKKASGLCAAALNKPCSLTLNKSDFKDLGVIINSEDGRMMYDNRFLARLERMYEDIYMELLKEVV
jgi:vacuolar-type H+-ATPase subunit E/Vma4